MVHDIPQDLLKGQHLALISAVKLVTGLDEWTSSTSRSKIRSKSLWPSSKCSKPCQYKKQISDFFFLPVGPMFGRHMRETLERCISHFFVWQLSIKIFMFNISSSKPISSTSETHSSLQKAAKKNEVAPHKKGSFVSFADLSIWYQVSHCKIIPA